ncbi:ABC transporter permease [Desulfosporosinus sp. BICA1-9]|uniref:ABC transporter permease n=1 Tax=Desulfosporosinus sp. BICA1-9 TaxID=1531958 RepID=UPI00054BAF84|nr:ABC transporter permease [Desulfosporosinus sp. BICA1-9]KJS50576.1 MAG: hypothetical protein VR66_02165 [Peptococcaceae bacterium BRH_c23]KJS82843.1 MAG: hypothetical protein JL57_23810 [Desulfosporosinus sp. BICA1-9]
MLEKSSNTYQNNSVLIGIRKVFQMRESILVLLILLQFIILTFASPYFFTKDNLIAVIFGCSLDAVVAVGMTYIIAAGEFDLSVGSTLALTGVIVAKLVLAGVNPIVAFIVGGVMIGAFIGFINGVIITKVGINSFITTLAMMGIVRGIAFVVTQGYPVSKLPSSFTYVGQSYVGAIPYTFFVMFVIVIVGEYLLRKIKYFRQVYYIGGNITAAKYSGINVDRVKIVMFMIIGILTGIAGTLMTARLGSAMSTAGQGMELRVISAVVIGGAALSGGEGTVFGTFLGVILLAFVTNALILLNVSIYWQGIISGLVLLVAVGIDIVTKKRKARK